MEKKIRIDRLLSELGHGSRTEIKKLLKKGIVTVNGEIMCRPECKVDPKVDRICFQGAPVKYETYEYYLLNKPAGYVTACKDNLHPTVLELIPSERTDLFPVGRLDIDTEGLLLVTNNGALSHHLLSPAHHVAKTYYVQLDSEVTVEQKSILEKGIDIGDKEKTLPAYLEIDSENKHHVRLTITEGRYHQVKRMFHALGHSVVYLQRISMGDLALPQTLSVGSAISLTEDQIQKLFYREDHK
ncbi:MAG: pseudouridine synthase [Lachnospiraceae bacterium]